MRHLISISSMLLLISCGSGAGPDGGIGTGGGGQGGRSGGGGGGGTGGGTTVTPGELGEPCLTGGACRSGFCVDGVCCNTACTDSCTACSMGRTGQNSGTCSPVPNGGQCRASAGACDVPEVCTNGACAPDAFADAGTSCRASTGACDLAETCTGDRATCPDDVAVDAGVMCRASTGPCDPAELCSGQAGPCPADAFAQPGTVCRAAAGVCDLDEVCSGSTPACPIDEKKAAGVVCRPSAGACDVVEACSGVDTSCPQDSYLPSSSLVCAPYRCTGLAANCSTTCGTTADCAPDVRSACNGTRCERGRLVFLSSTSYLPNFAVGSPDGGIARADGYCQQLANDAGLGGNFLAWLADLTSSPSTRFVRDGGMYIRMGDKALIARDWADLTDGTIGATITVSERRTTPTLSMRGVMTGSTQVGTSATFSGGQTNTHCSFWTSTSNTFFGTVGEPTNLVNVGAWTNAANPSCGVINAATVRLYCFEQ